MTSQRVKGLVNVSERDVESKTSQTYEPNIESKMGQSECETIREQDQQDTWRKQEKQDWEEHFQRV